MEQLPPPTDRETFRMSIANYNLVRLAEAKVNDGSERDEIIWRAAAMYQFKQSELADGTHFEFLKDERLYPIYEIWPLYEQKTGWQTTYETFDRPATNVLRLLGANESDADPKMFDQVLSHYFLICDIYRNGYPISFTLKDGSRGDLDLTWLHDQHWANQH